MFDSVILVRAIFNMIAIVWSRERSLLFSKIFLISLWTLLTFHGEFKYEFKERVHTRTFSEKNVFQFSITRTIFKLCKKLRNKTLTNNRKVTQIGR